MTDVVSGLAFLGFVLAGLALVCHLRRARDSAHRQRAISVFVAYVLCVSFAAGIGQRNLWPFASWNLMVPAAPSSQQRESDWHPVRIVGVTPDGREHRIDYRVWQPFSYAELIDAWLAHQFPRLSADEQAGVGTWLLSQANAGREAVLDGRTPGTWERILGPLTAPAHFVHVRRWRAARDVPSQPFSHVRIYLDYFNVETRVLDSTAVRLVLLYQYPP